MSKIQKEEIDYSKIPFERIVQLGQRSLLYTDLFCVSWLLGRFCNYRCSYCWRHGRSSKIDHRPTELIIKTLNEIKRQARERGFNSFHFSFSGGEPTLHPGYLKILEYYCKDVLNANYQSLHMTTNLSPGLKWFERYANITKDIHRVSITASWHPEFAKREPFLKKLLFCMENDIQITINMVMVPARFKKLWNDAAYFYKHGVNVTLKPQSDPTASFVVKGYTKEMLERMRHGLPQIDFTKKKMQQAGKISKRPKRKQIYSQGYDDSFPSAIQVELVDSSGKKWYMDQAERFNAFGFNKFKGWECSSGFRSIVIREPDGSIKRSYSCHDKPLGYIDKGFKLFDKPQPCITPTCVSSADSKIPKTRKKENNNICEPTKKIRYYDLLMERLGERGVKSIKELSQKEIEIIFNELDCKFLDIKIHEVLQSVNVELTTRCSSNCKFCGRQLDKVKYVIDLPFETFKKVPIEDLRILRLEGTLGDPIHYPFILEVLEEVRKRRNKDLSIIIYTNGNKYNEKWWAELAGLLSFHKKNKIMFGLDGLEDTHALYRKGVDFKRVIRNIRAFTRAGGNAEVQMIVFEHNEHQIQDLKRLCLDIGCKNFYTRLSKKYDEELKTPKNFAWKSRVEQTKIEEDRGVPTICGMMHFGESFLTCDGLLIPCFKWHMRRLFWKKDDQETRDMYWKNIPYMNLNHYDFYEILNNNFLKYLKKNLQNMKECGQICRTLEDPYLKKI